ncbi:hypothetical protein RJ639_016558 [Escallonia herrerae]|uniref:Non-haem dioxygenase N-terminal domain-containing protein n=1 Tax=Escallonia herrerae TaxID=1293975 RepID=A0AA88VE38_9ASTE|nr:hypothetical protein RJ639_016558 [Escallonia herrerae]
MAITSTQTRSRSSAPVEPPSPIPTGKGSRSAANSIFSNYVDESKRIPELTLPGYGHRSVLPDIDYKSLVSRDPDYVDLLLRSVLQFGAFRINGHGISGEELRLEAESLLGVSSENRLRYGDHKELLLCSLDNDMAASVKDMIGAENYRSLSGNDSSCGLGVGSDDFDDSGGDVGIGVKDGMDMVLGNDRSVGLGGASDSKTFGGFTGG